MKNIKIKYIFGLILTLFMIGVNAQTQIINFGDIKNYVVDEADGPKGTEGSTYEWTVWTTAPTPEDITSTLTITPQTTSKNKVQINWGTTASGTYTLRVIETNNTCKGDEQFITVVINAVNQPTLKADNKSTCSGVAVNFVIENAPANSKVKFTTSGGKSITTSPVIIDSSGKATIEVTPTASSTQIQVILIEMELSNGTIVDINPDVLEQVTVTPEVSTSVITFD
ncbi:hypothetical protein [Empedobacter brevis]|uniref:hypothetical protein n=1 Tax=Empedobacter brevis TaxID=247 RepID=UPI0039B01F7B